MLSGRAAANGSTGRAQRDWLVGRSWWDTAGTYGVAQYLIVIILIERGFSSGLQKMCCLCSACECDPERLVSYAVLYVFWECLCFQCLLTLLHVVWVLLSHVAAGFGQPSPYSV